MKIQATAIAFQNRAYLITGDAGIGKSSLALALIRQGASLIADDLAELDADSMVSAVDDEKKWLEVRGLGLVSGFPVSKREKLAAVINLRPTEPERMTDSLTIQLNGTEYPLFFLWGTDKNLSDKFWVIDQIMAQKLVLETRKDCI